MGHQTNYRLHASYLTYLTCYMCNEQWTFQGLNLYIWFIIANYNWHGLLHGYTFFIQIDWPLYRNLLEQIPVVLVLLSGNCPLIFKHTCSFSKHSVLLPRLIHTFYGSFWTSIFDCNFEISSSCKFISFVLKSEYILIDYWLNDLVRNRTLNHLSVWVNGWVFVYKLGDCGFESRCSHL